MSSRILSRSLLALAISATAFASCASVSESASADTMTANVGIYAPPPPGAVRPKVGVPPFSVTGKAAKKEMNSVAADTMSTLMVQSQRFTVIERAQLDILLAEQNLSGIVKPGELAVSGQVNGIDLMLIGRVTNFRTKIVNTKAGFGLGKIGLGNIGLGGGDYKKDEVTITTECGVDIRLVDPTSGAVAVANFSEFKREDKASAMGIEVLGFNATADADMRIADDDHGKLMRLALDEALRKTLPAIDSYIASTYTLPAAVTPAAAAPAPTTPGATAFCSQCGAGIVADAKFCGACGTAIN